MKKPNIVLIMTDQHRFDFLGCYNNKHIKTPNIDWIAQNGTVFTSAYSQSPSCVPARACLMTGKTPWNAGILGMGKGQYGVGVNFENTLPAELAKAGYYTKGIGKMHFYPQRSLLGFHSTVLDESGRVEDENFVSDYMQWFNEQKTGDYSPVDHGVHWNSWMSRPWHLPEYMHPTVWTANEAVKFLQTKDPSMPFFLKVSFARPHSPYDPPDYYFNMYSDSEVPEAKVADWAKVHDVKEDAAEFDAWRGEQKSSDVMLARKAYSGQISHIDNQIGRILIKLKSIDELDNTMFIFTSDHGDMLGDHNLWRKTYAYEGSAHIPLIIKLPKNYCGNTASNTDKPVTLCDIMPTILDFVNVETPSSVDGKSLLPHVTGEKVEWRKYIHGEHCEIYAPQQEMQYVTDGKKKFVWLPQTGEKQFFDLQNDPYEMMNEIDNEQLQPVIREFENYLCEQLEARNNNTAKNNKLICQNSDEPQISPYYKQRLDTSDYKWM